MMNAARSRMTLILRCHSMASLCAALAVLDGGGRLHRVAVLALAGEDRG
jgi:hypothetical protein